MTNERPTYHHGDLRSKLIEAAMDCIERDGVAKLSLRKIASHLGVSHNAPYMHFASKDALLDAVIAQGFAAMRAQIAQAGGDAPFTGSDWSDRVKRGFREYVAFAKARPGLYALMHVPRGAEHAPEGTESPKADADASSKATLKGLATTLEAGQSLGRVRPGDTEEMALWVWVTLHGLASLTSDDRLAFDGRSPEVVAETVLDNLVQSLAG